MVDLLARFFGNDSELRVYNADNSSKADVFISDLELWVKGFCVSNIQSLGPIFFDIIDPSLEMQWARQASAVDDKLAMLRTLSADVRWDGSHLVSRWHSIDFSYEYRDHDTLTSEEREKKADIRTNLKTSTHYRRLLWTSNDHIGLAPSDAEIGDKICVFYGGSVLYVIRKNKEKPGYTFVGECYVDGFMNGEAAALLHGESTQEEVFVLD
jgi:hypothetical protein